MPPPRDQKPGPPASIARDLDGGPPPKRPSGPVPGRPTSTGAIPVQTATPGKASPTGSIPVQAGGATPTGTPPVQAAPSGGESGRTNRSLMTDAQRALAGDAFRTSDAERKRANFIGTSTDPGTMKVLQGDEPRDFVADGVTPAPEVSDRNAWRVVTPPLTSREGKRSRELYEQVVMQFAIGHNPRYAEDAPGKPRGHIFVWDVSRAMGCEIPHFVGARELTLVQTSDWLRHEGPMRGWLRATAADLYELADQGLMVVVVPRDLKVRQIAIALPQEPAVKPLVTGAGLVVGANVPVAQMFGVSAIECFYHP